MLGYCSFSQLLLQQTLDPKPSIAPLCRHWRHTTNLRMVIIAIIRIKTLIKLFCYIPIIRIMIFIFIDCVSQDSWNPLAPESCTVTSLTTESQFRVFTSYPFRISSENFLLSPSVIPEQFYTTYTMFFLGLPATAGRVKAMVSGCGLSTRGLLVCPVICKWNVEQSIETCSISAHTLGLNLTIILISPIILNEKIKIMNII